MDVKSRNGEKLSVHPLAYGFGVLNQVSVHSLAYIIGVLNHAICIASFDPLGAGIPTRMYESPEQTLIRRGRSSMTVFQYDI